MRHERMYQGTVRTGIGGAASEMTKPGIPAKFRKITGLPIIPGTLNIRLSEPLDLSLLRYVKYSDIGWEFDPAVQGIDFHGETGMYYRRATVAGKYPVCLIIFSWVKDIYIHAEMCSPYHLRTVLNLHDGDIISFTFDDDTPQ